MWIVFSYIWLPFMILPVWAAIERVPDSFLEASRDLGARGWTTFRAVVLPLVLPGRRRRLDLHVLADARRLHHADARRRRGSDFIGNVVYRNVGIANNVPFAAAFATVPLVVMGVYLCWRGAPARSRRCDGGPRSAGRARRLDGADRAVPVLPDRDHPRLRVQPVERAELAAGRPLDEVVLARLAQRGDARTRCGCRCEAALLATAIALVLGSMAAFAVHRFRFFGREAVSFLLVLPIALPGIITGMALNSFFYLQRRALLAAGRS